MSATVAPASSRSDSVRVAVIASSTDEASRLKSAVEVAGIQIGDLRDSTVALIACPAFRQKEADQVRALREAHPGARVVVLTRASDVTRTRLVLEAGASGLVVDEDCPDALAPALTAVAAGQLCLPSGYRAQIGKPTFTQREKQILGLVVLGLSNGEISRKLYLAESTVKSHLSSAFVKLGVRSRNEATAIIVDPASGLGPGILRITEDLRLSPRSRP